jgi:hypothetical protein
MFRVLRTQAWDEARVHTRAPLVLPARITAEARIAADLLAIDRAHTVVRHTAPDLTVVPPRHTTAADHRLTVVAHMDARRPLMAAGLPVMAVDPTVVPLLPMAAEDRHRMAEAGQLHLMGAAVVTRADSVAADMRPLEVAVTVAAAREAEATAVVEATAAADIAELLRHCTFCNAAFGRRSFFWARFSDPHPRPAPNLAYPASALLASAATRVAVEIVPDLFQPVPRS